MPVVKRALTGPQTETFTTAGTVNWVCPAGVSQIDVVEQTGAGGSGAGAVATSGSFGTGGGGGEYVSATGLPVTPGVTYVLSVPAGGPAHTAAAGTAGGDAVTTWDGGVQVTAHGGGGGHVSSTLTGAGGTGATAGTHHDGGAGGTGAATGTVHGGGGGGSAGSTGAGGAASGSAAGAAGTGTTAGAAGGAGGTGTTAGTQVGGAGAAPGGGGGGAISTGTARASGKGGDGQIILHYTITSAVSAPAGAATAAGAAGDVATRLFTGKLGLSGAYLDPVVYGTDQAGAVTAWAAKTGRALGLRVTTYGAGIIPADATTDQPAAPPPPPPVGGYGLVGATVNPTFYNSTWKAIATTWDGWVNQADNGTRRLARAAQKYYFQAGQLPATAPQAIVDLVTMGAVVYVCVKPSKSNTASDKAALDTCIGSIVAAVPDPAKIKCVIYQEANIGSNGVPYFADGPTYLTYWDFYAPSITKHGVPLVYDPALSSGLGSTSRCKAYAPVPASGVAHPCGEYLIDWYCSAFLSGLHPEAASGVMAQADADNLPFGIGEWGPSAAGTTPSPTDWGNYCDNIVSIWQGRVAAGKTNAPIIYFNGSGTSAGQPNNMIQSGTDFHLPKMRATYDALSSLAQ